MQCNVLFTITNEKKANHGTDWNLGFFKEKSKMTHVGLGGIPHVCNWNIAINYHFFFFLGEQFETSYVTSWQD